MFLLKANQVRIIIEQMVQLFAELFYEASIQLPSSNISINVLACLLVHIYVILLILFLFILHEQCR